TGSGQIHRTRRGGKEREHPGEHDQGRQHAHHARGERAGRLHQAVTSSRIRSVSHCAAAVLGTLEGTTFNGREASGSTTDPHWMNTPVRARLRSAKARHWVSFNPRR